MPNLLHNVTHKHTTFHRFDVDITICASWRFFRWGDTIKDVALTYNKRVWCITSSEAVAVAESLNDVEEPDPIAMMASIHDVLQRPALFTL